MSRKSAVPQLLNSDYRTNLKNSSKILFENSRFPHIRKRVPYLEFVGSQKGNVFLRKLG